MIIRAEQMAACEQAARRRFEDEMAAHGKEFTPRLCAVIGDAQLRLALQLAIRRAEQYGLTCRGPIRLFIELTFLWGSAFDTDPQYPAAREILCSADDEMRRAERLHESYLNYLETVSGPNAANVHHALKRMLSVAKTQPPILANGFVPTMLDGMSRIFPQKASYVGEPGLRALIDESLAEARRYNFFPIRHQALLVALKFAFGHGCTDDPLYPWIARTLTDERIIDPTGRAERLENKAVTWLEHVVAVSDQRPT